MTKDMTLDDLKNLLKKQGVSEVEITCTVGIVGIYTMQRNLSVMDAYGEFLEEMIGKDKNGKQ